MNVLPVGFDELEVFVADWAWAAEVERNCKRISSGMDAISSFYKAIYARIDEITEHLDRFSLEQLPSPEEKLLQLALMFMEVAPAVELFRQPTVPDAFPMARFEILQP